MRILYQRGIFGLGLVLLAGICGLALAESAVRTEHPRDVEAVTYDTGIGWEIRVRYPSAMLSIADSSGRILKEHFESDTNPWLEIRGRNWKDGLYTWELRLDPEADGSPVRVETGHFWIINGKVERDTNSSDRNPFQPQVPLAAYDVSGDWVVSGALGAGTDSPSSELDLESSSPSVEMTDTTGGTDGWYLHGWDTSFKIQDKSTGNTVFEVMNGAPSGSFHVSSTGQVGLGTSTPSALFHIENASGDDSDDVVVTSAGKVGVGTTGPANGVHVKSPAPGFIFEETDFGNQKWQMAALNGEWRIRDLSGGNVYPFRVAPGIGGTAFMIASSGNVGIGTDKPSSKLHVIGSIFATGGVSSSRELKEDITTLNREEARETLLHLNPVKFFYRDDSDRDLQLGFIAEEVPDLVSTPGRKGIQPMDLIAVLVKTTQAQDEEIQRLSQDLNTQRVGAENLKIEVQELRAQLQDLENVKSELARIRQMLQANNLRSVAIAE